MRLAIPSDLDQEHEILSRPTSVSNLKAWDNLLSEEGRKTTVSTNALDRCPICQEKGV